MPEPTIYTAAKPDRCPAGHTYVGRSDTDLHRTWWAAHMAHDPQPVPNGPENPADETETGA